MANWIRDLNEQISSLVPWDHSPVLRHVEGGLISSYMEPTVNEPLSTAAGTGDGPLFIPAGTPLHGPQEMLAGTTNRPPHVIAGA